MSDVDPWDPLRALTPARIGLGRTGPALPARRVLELRLAHAEARDAVWREPEWSRIERDLDAQGVPWVSVHSQVPNRETYLLRPDLGRQLDTSDAPVLAEVSRGAGSAVPRFDLVVCLIDGLSGAALSHNGVPLVVDLVERFGQLGWRVSPVVLAHLGRVALGDHIGSALGATLAMVVIGERPGLSAADSLGIYLTYGPRPGRTDAERTCISNVRPDGLPLDLAARLAISQAQHARQQGYTGTSLR